MHVPGPRETLRFGDFELDEGAYELRRFGRPVKLGRQPMDLLLLLIARRGQLVTRNDIVDRLWAKDVFVDVETGVNTAISKIRQALRDSPDAPAFLETVPGKGYRFIATVEPKSVSQPLSLEPPPAPPVPEPGSDSTDGESAEARLESRPRRATSVRVGVGLMIVSVAIAIAGLTSLRSGRPPASATLAVLPFENIGSDPEREYLAAGLTAETSASLAQIDPDRLSVKGRSVLYKGTTKTAAEIGRELSVDYLVESSIRAEGTRLRVTVTLMRAKDQGHVWSQSYDREATGLLGLQQELSTAIAEQIRLRLTPDRLNGLGRRQTQSADAYDAYLRGRDQVHRRTAEGNSRAISLLMKAVAIDKDYALAWSDLAFAYAGGAINGDARPAVVGPLAHDAAVHAVRANAGLSEAQMAIGYDLWMIDWDWTAARAALQLAVDLDPSNATAYRLLGHALSQAGRRSEAETAMRRSRELDPMDAMTHALSAQVAFQNRDVVAARDHARLAILINPDLWIV
jgi:TolB-like protein/DNA-binding winged helix-turn-helix (wHTH) protein